MAIHPPPVLIPRGPGCPRRTAISNRNFPNAATACPRNRVARSAVRVHVANFSKRCFSSSGPIASVARSETQLEHKTDEDDPASRRSGRRSTIRPVAMHQLSHRPNRREANSGLRSLLQTVRKIITGSLNLSLTGGCAGCLRFSTRFEGADDADALLDSSKIQFYHALVLLVRARRVGRDVGRSIARFGEFVLD
jgi:hypothetical protein